MELRLQAEIGIRPHLQDRIEMQLRIDDAHRATDLAEQAKGILVTELPHVATVPVEATDRCVGGSRYLLRVHTIARIGERCAPPWSAIAFSPPMSSSTMKTTSSSM